jgi:hypothetical protein
VFNLVLKFFFFSGRKWIIKIAFGQLLHGRCPRKEGFSMGRKQLPE